MWRCRVAVCSFCAALAWRRHTGARRRQVQRVLTPLVFGLAHLCLKHPSVAASYSNIGLVYDSQGRYEEALVQYQQALAVFLAVHGQEHHSWPPPTTTLVVCI